MVAALIIVFREIVEAGLIAGIALAVSARIPHSRRWISAGIAAGVLGSCLLAVFTASVAEAFDGMGQELFNAAILALAVVMLAWHNIWMARHGRELSAEIRAVGAQVESGGRTMLALAVVVGVAVLREGAEVVLFLYGIVVSNGGSFGELLAGGIGGVILGVGFSALTYLGLLRIPVRYLFAFTGWLIALLAAGMAAQSVSFLERAGVVEILPDTVWDTSWLLSESSIPGRVLHTLVGYMDQPTALELLVYVVTLATILTLSWLFNPRRNVAVRVG